ncbi:MAG: c-type cytochrome [Anaerolineae bacterium]|nr:c-type cytochrome [Anaerolineae bacterium]
MSQHHQTQNETPLNVTLVALIFIVNFIIIGGLIYSNSTMAAPQPDGGQAVEVALAEPTQTPTALPPTFTPLPTLPPTTTLAPSATPTAVPTTTSTPESAAVVAAANAGGSDPDYDPALVAQGETLFLLCAACHGPDARGLPNLGKDLVESEFVLSLSDEELLAFVQTGRPLWDPMNTTGIDMPARGGNPALTDEDIMALIAYIRALASSNTGGVAESAGEPQAVAAAAQTSTSETGTSYDPALVSEGEQLFMQCAACHGPDARGLPNLGKDLVESEFVHSLSDEELLAFVQTGRPLWDPMNTTGIDMPPKGGNPALTDEQILAIIAYVRSLSASNN